MGVGGSGGHSTRLTATRPGASSRRRGDFSEAKQPDQHLRPPPRPARPQPAACLSFPPSEPQQRDDQCCPRPYPCCCPCWPSPRRPPTRQPPSPASTQPVRACPPSAHLLASCSSSTSTEPRPAVPSAEYDRYVPSGQGMFRCLDGSKTIPFTAVNDDYCDCPDGSDEPGRSQPLSRRLPRGPGADLGAALERLMLARPQARRPARTQSSSAATPATSPAASSRAASATVSAVRLCDPWRALRATLSLKLTVDFRAPPADPECCDGTDEPTGECPNVCAELGRETREKDEAAAKIRRTVRSPPSLLRASP